jgi:hypothetical protein
MPESNTPEENPPEYAFDGFKVEFSAKVILIPAAPESWADPGG